MMKFFRKHNKKLLAVFTALLMFAFVGGVALQSLITRGDGQSIVAKTTHGSLRSSDLTQARFATSLVAQMGYNWSQPWFGSAEPLTTIDWLLLVRESRRLGAIPPDAAVRQILSRRGTGDAVVRRVAVRQDVAEEAIYAAVADNLGVLAVLGGMLGAAEPSEAEVRQAARDEMEKVSIEAVPLRASNFVDDSAEFTETEIVELFEQFKDRDPGPGLTFGYRVPPRVQVQYFKIDLTTVADRVHIGESTLEKKARSYWEDNKRAAVFRRPPEPDPKTETETETETESETEDETEDEGSDAETEADDSTDQPVDGDAADEEPSETAAPKRPRTPYFETFDEAREAAIRSIRRESAVKQAKNLSNQLLGALLEPWYAIDDGDDGYKTAPAAVADLDYYQQVLDRTLASARYANAVTVGNTELFAATDARSLADIGPSGTTPVLGTARVQFSQAAFSVRGIVEMPDDLEIDRSQFLAQYQTYPAGLSDTDGNVYLFRVVAVDEAHTPTTIDDHRDRVIENLKLQRAFSEAVTAAETLAQTARTAGLATAWEAAEELQSQATRAKLITPRPFPREGYPGSGLTFKAFLTDLGAVGEPFVSACFELGEQEETQGPRVTTIELLETGDPMIVVVQWTATEPIYEDTFLTRRNGIAQRIRAQRERRLGTDWLDSDNIRARAGYELPQG